jgi:hypothetical protein
VEMYKEQSKKQTHNLAFEVLAAVTMRSSASWDIMSCTPVKVSQGRNQHEAGSMQSSLFFYPEVGGDMLFRNVCWLSSDYTALISDSITLQIHTFLYTLT